MIRAAVVTISDSCSAGTREDAAGPAVAARAESLGWQVTERATLPDEIMQIAARLAQLADSRAVDVVLTTGGTGVSPRDVTPEATRAVLEREIPGLGELMRSQGRQSTPWAVLSRAVAGARGRCLIVNLPGSPKGALESLDAVAGLAPHILALLRGDTEHDPGQRD